MSTFDKMSEVTHHELDAGTSLSFDEVESLTMSDAAEAAEKAQEVKVDTEEIKNEVKEAVEEAVKKQSDKLPKTSDQETVKEALQNQEEEGEAAAKEELAEAKRLEAKYGEEQYNIPADAIFRHKVDKEEQEVSLQDLLNNYSGKVAWDKKFSELDTERKSFREERELIERYIDEFGAKVNNGDAIGAIEFLAQFAGVDPLNFRRMVRESLTPQIKNYLELDEQGQKLFNQKEELEFFKRQRETETQQAQEKQAAQELNAALDEFQQARGLNEDEMVQLYDDLAKHIPAEQINLDLMGQVLDQEHRIKTGREALSEVNQELLQDETNLNLLVEVMKENPDFTKEDLVLIVQDVYGKPAKKAAQNLTRKISGKKAEPKEKAETKSKMDKVLLDFDQL